MKAVICVVLGLLLLQGMDQEARGEEVENPEWILSSWRKATKENSTDTWERDMRLDEDPAPTLIRVWVNLEGTVQYSVQRPCTEEIEYGAEVVTVPVSYEKAMWNRGSQSGVMWHCDGSVTSFDNTVKSEKIIGLPRELAEDFETAH